MTINKSISIRKDHEEFYEKLNQITPSHMSVSEQVGRAVEHFVTSETKNIDEFLTDKRPDFLAPIDDWKKYFAKHPEKVGDLIRRHIQLGNLLEKEECYIK